MSLSSRYRVIKTEARKTLFSFFGYCLCISSLILTVLCGVSAMVRSVDVFLYRFFSTEVFFSLIVLYKLLLLVLLAPLIYGVFGCFRKISAREKLSAYELIRGYTSKRRYCDALKLVVIISVFCISLFVFHQLISLILDLIFQKIVFISQNIVVSLIAKLLFLLLVFLSYTVFCGFACILRCNNGSVISSIKQSFILMKGHKVEFLLFCASFIPLFFLSHFTMGLLYIFSIPYFLISVSCFLNYVVSEKFAPEICDFS